ncbi:centrosomal protein of 70 kDa isoform X2 [Pseudoliparis swirei]|uniref:centrosomal protein of 70 kDa isoform X2 n=1 Tax=Pseudoliparis swirei TaxID=2059687 RepID=UPI0024BE2B2E|nr:centrosomal protein of 70 kDa isoform X2 [Pseudoliparis swirei]
MDSRSSSSNKTYVYLWTSRQLQEQVEWDAVNTLLQHRGFRPVQFADPVENKNIPDLVLLDKKSAGEIRTTLRTMLSDSERRQALVQELVKANNQLKEEARGLAGRAAQQARRATELEGLLDLVRTRVQDLEERYLGKAARQQSHTLRLQQDRREARNQSRALEQELCRQREEAAQLQRKLYFTTKEEERRLKQEARLAPEALVSEAPGEPGLCAHDHQLLTDIGAVVTNPNAPLRRQRPSSAGLDPAECRTVLPTLEVWAQQLRLLEDLQRALQKLTVSLMPCWQPAGHGAAEAVKVEDLLLLVGAMLESTAAEGHTVLRSPTRHTLGSMVSHFQKLFDVASLMGVFPRMNEVYGRLGVMSSALRNLRDVLQLDCRVPPAQVVEQVARLVASSQPAGVQHLLGDADIDSIIVKVKQHDEFFPAFHGLVTEILHTLGVSLLDDILPALKSLKQAAQ